MERNEKDLLALEVDVIHGLAPGRAGVCARVTDPSVRAVWSWSPGARLLALGPDVEDPGTADGSAQPYAPGETPVVLTRIAAALQTPGEPVGVQGGPCFTFPDRLATHRPAPFPLLVSDAEGRGAARKLRRPDNWQPGEWAELIAGAAGEWVMAVRDGEPVSICHTPAANTRAAEAGIWTRADHRGRGLAPATVAAWARREGPRRDVLFYSTTIDNHASRGVARALGLTPLGWIWTVR
ncbi:GNAT family N-acetyltransferase [Streptomyces kanamyceticus]|uniref:GNAT family N-acetyltransferase n=1 Tax=Streptomyces kanamyceticus TaxID=1967 RepID=A0A5J6GRP2_STRKN|nr:GNAT family N-acetyltransferase [Streptomyces kanamyceticus]QEU96478.1 GNAT family N-acetyltransferase [Streptomyces kanamyceticus]